MPAPNSNCRHELRHLMTPTGKQRKHLSVIKKRNRNIHKNHIPKSRDTNSESMWVWGFLVFSIVTTHKHLMYIPLLIPSESPWGIGISLIFKNKDGRLREIYWLKGQQLNGTIRIVQVCLTENPNLLNIYTCVYMCIKYMQRLKQFKLYIQWTNKSSSYPWGDTWRHANLIYSTICSLLPHF